MPNNIEQQDQIQRQGTTPSAPKPQPSPRDKGMVKRSDRKDLDKLDDDGSPLRECDDDIEPTNPR